MAVLMRLSRTKALVLMLFVCNIMLFSGSHLSQAAPGDAVGDCWKINPQNNQPVAVNLVASPNNPIDCALPANTCKTKNTCTPSGAQFIGWTDAIKVGDCTKPNKNGNCQACPEKLTCAVGDLYNNANDCNNQQNKVRAVTYTCVNGNCCK